MAWNAALRDKKNQYNMMFAHWKIIKHIKKGNSNLLFEYNIVEVAISELLIFMAKSSHVAAISVHFASSVAWDDLRPTVARSQNVGSVHGERLSTWRATCLTRFPHVVSAKISPRYLWKRKKSLISLRHARVWPNSPTATLAKLVSNGRLEFHF